MRSIISHTVLTVRFSGWDVCEQQEACVFRQAADQSQNAQQQLWQPSGKASAVKVEVGDSHQVSRRRVQANAAAPDVALRYAADGWTDWRQVVWYLAVSVRWVLKVVHKGNKEAGNEACQRQQDCPHSKAGEWQLNEGPVPVPVKAAVRPLEHPGSEKKDENWAVAELEYTILILLGTYSI